MKPEVWGPHAWIFLHSITFNYPDNPTEDEKKHYKNFFENLKFILPCDLCKEHYKINIKKKKLTDKVLSSRKNLIEWLIDIHNEVNKRNKKKKLKYKEVVKKYLDFYEGKNNDNNNLNKCIKPSITSNLVIIISIIIITLFILKKRIYI